MSDKTSLSLNFIVRCFIVQTTRKAVAMAFIFPKLLVAQTLNEILLKSVGYGIDSSLNSILKLMRNHEKKVYKQRGIINKFCPLQKILLFLPEKPQYRHNLFSSHYYMIVYFHAPLFYNTLNRFQGYCLNLFFLI